MRVRALLSTLLLTTALASGAHADGQAPAPAPPPPQGQAQVQAPPGPSPESLAAAQAYVDAGRRELSHKKYAAALVAFQTAAGIAPSGGAFLGQASAYELLDHQVLAADAYARALGAGGLSAPEASSAKERLDALERAMATLDVKGPPGYVVQLDDNAETPVPARLHGMPGIRRLAIAPPEKPIARRDLRLEAGRVTPLALKDEPAAPPVPAAQRADAPAATPSAPRVVTVEAPQGPVVRRAIGAGVIGLGLASLGAALVLGLETVDARNAFNASPSRPLYDHEQTLQTWTNVSLVAGAVLVVGGAALVLWPSGGGEARVGLAPTPGGASVVGRF